MFIAQTLQGRLITEEDLREIREVIGSHPQWSRRRISVELAQRWNWRGHDGQLKDMAARTLDRTDEVNGMGGYRQLR